MKALLLGCGHDRALRLRPDGRAPAEETVTLDMNPTVGADVVHDLERMPLPFSADIFDEIHAYDVLEHVGRQGDWRFFFRQFEEFHRILRPGGLVCAIVPRWDTVWAWGDPGHTRVISEGSLGFLSQAVYAAECKPGGTNRTDYRFAYRADFDVIWQQQVSEAQLGFILRAVKPSRR